MKDCPLCDGSGLIVYGDLYTDIATGESYVGWETGREIACGCTQLVAIRGEAS
jgi:hypothetical protein